MEVDIVISESVDDLIYLPWIGGQKILAHTTSGNVRLYYPPNDSDYINKDIEFDRELVSINKETGDLFTVNGNNIFKNGYLFSAITPNSATPDPETIDPVRGFGGFKNICIGKHYNNTTSNSCRNGNSWSELINYLTGTIVSYDSGLFRAVLPSLNILPSSVINEEVNTTYWERIGTIPIMSSEFGEVKGSLKIVNNSTVPPIPVNIPAYLADINNDAIAYMVTNVITDDNGSPVNIWTPVTIESNGSTSENNETVTIKQIFDNGSCVHLDAGRKTRKYDDFNIVIGGVAVNCNSVNKITTGAIGADGVEQPMVAQEIIVESVKGKVKGNNSFLGDLVNGSYVTPDSVPSFVNYSCTYYDVSSAFTMESYNGHTYPFYLPVWNQAFYKVENETTYLDGSWIGQYFYNYNGGISSNVGEYIGAVSELIGYNAEWNSCNVLWHDNSAMLIHIPGDNNIILYDRVKKSRAVVFNVLDEYGKNNIIKVLNANSKNSTEWDFDKKQRQLNENKI